MMFTVCEKNEVCGVLTDALGDILWTSVPEQMSLFTYDKAQEVRCLVERRPHVGVVCEVLPLEAVLVRQWTRYIQQLAGVYRIRMNHEPCLWLYQLNNDVVWGTNPLNAKGYETMEEAQIDLSLLTLWHSTLTIVPFEELLPPFPVPSGGEKDPDPPRLVDDLLKAQ